MKKAKQTPDDCLLKKFTAHTLDGVFESDMQGHFTDVNAAGAGMLGYSRQEILRLDIPDILDKKETPRVFSEIAKLARGKATRTEWCFYRKDGSYFWGDVVALRLDQHRLLATVRDITERKQAEAALRESEAVLRQLTETIQDVFWVATPDSQKLIYISSAYETIWGQSRDYLMAHPTAWMEAIEPEDRAKVLKARKRLGQGAEPYNVEYRIRRPDGSYRWIYDRGFVVRDGDGPILRIVGVAKDTTERKKLERALEDKNTALKEILVQLATEKKQMEDRFMANAENLLLPAVKRLRRKAFSDAEKKYFNILENNLKELTSMFGSRMGMVSFGLTPREIEICSLIRGGIGSKEISTLFNLSLGTVETHRNRIRKKLGISKQEINLTSFLQMS